MTTIVESAGDPAPVPDVAAQTRRFYLAIPFYLLVPVAGWALYRAFGVRLDWRAVGLGALGWWVALLLRAPLALAARRTSERRGRLIVVSASGPMEEGVRLAALALTATHLSWALSLGLGWAAIEVLFAIANGLVVLRILRRDDEQARQARELLEAQGTLRDDAPWLGVLERAFASAVHVGFTLWIAASPWLAIPAAVAHSAINLAMLRLARRLRVMIAALAAAGAAVLAVGLALALR